MTTYAPKPGDYVVTTDLPRDAIAIFMDDMRKAGAKEGTPLERAKERTYFGWDLRDNTVYTCNGLEVARRTLFHNNVTDYYRRVHAMTSTTARNPFQTGDRVVPNGFKARPDGDYYYGTNPTMERWERDKTVLHVQGSGSESVRAGCEPNFYSYHLAELRMATAEEIVKADTPKAPEQPALATGMVIRASTDGEVMIVRSPNPDSDGDIRVLHLSRADRLHFRLSSGYTVLGQVMPDGDFRPAETIRSATDPSQWKEGQHVRCITDEHHYITKGRVYTLIADATVRAGVTRISIFDNDGDEAIYRAANQFEAV